MNQKYKISIEDAVAYAGNTDKLMRILGVELQTIIDWNKNKSLSHSASYRLAAIAPHRFSPPERKLWKHLN